VEQVQQKTPKRIRVVEHTACEDKLRDLGFSLQMRQLREVAEGDSQQYFPIPTRRFSRSECQALQSGSWCEDKKQ